MHFTSRSKSLRMQFSLISLLFTLFVVSTLGIHPFDYHPVDEVKEVCYALKFKNDIGMTVDLKKGMSYQEMIWLGVWNMKFKFCDGPNSNLKYSKIKWRLPIIDAIFKLFNSACPNEFVPQGFLNALHHLILIYYNSETGSRAAPESRWKNTILTLDRCINETAPLKLEGSALVIDNLILKDEPVAILPPHEIADDNLGTDLIIDIFWWLFSFSFGSCYSPASYRSSWAPRYKKLFHDDFLEPLLRRWSLVDPHTDFGYIFGNFDLKNLRDNIRMCVTAAYTRLGISDRQLIRPYTFSRVANFKTGDIAVK